MSDQEKLRYVDIFVTYSDTDHVIPKDLLIEGKHVKDMRIIYCMNNYGMRIQSKQEKSLFTEAWSKLTALFGNQPQRIARPPGSRLDALASFVFTRRFYDTVLRPCLADMQDEYFEALSHGRLRKAQWVRVRGVACFWSHLVIAAMGIFRKLWVTATG